MAENITNVMLDSVGVCVECCGKWNNIKWFIQRHGEHAWSLFKYFFM